MSSSGFARPTSSALPHDNRRRAQYWPQVKAPQVVGLGLVLAFNFDDDSQSHTEGTGTSATHPQSQRLPRRLATQEEVLASMAMAPDYSSPLDAPRMQQCEFPRPVGPPLQMRRSFANHVPYGHVSSSDEDSPDLDALDMSYLQRADDSLPESIDYSPTPMRRTMAIRRRPIEYSASDSEFDEEPWGLEPIMAEPVVGIAVTDPKYRQIVMWAVEVERETKDVVPDCEDEEKPQSTKTLAKLSQGSWLRWTCLTR